MGSGLHRENGLGPETSIHLPASFGVRLDVVLPKATLVEKLEKTYKQCIKHILSLPVTVADPAVYVLSGALPMESVESVIHKRALVLFGCICMLSEESIEKRLVRWQLASKTCESSSWFVATREVSLKYVGMKWVTLHQSLDGSPLSTSM